MNATDLSPLQVTLSEAQLGYLSYRFPNDDPEDALVKLLERDRARDLKRAEAKVQVLHLQSPPPDPPTPPQPQKPVLPLTADNPIGALQEYCQQTGSELPVYGFEEVAEGFACTVQAIGASALGVGRSKQVAKTEAAAQFLKSWRRC